MAERIGNQLIADNWERVWRPRDRRPIYEWAKENIYLPASLTRTEWFDVGRSRQFLAPFDALQNDRVREVNICAPVRDGKTLIADIWLPWLIVNAPGPFRWVFQDEQAAKDQLENRVRPILKAVPEIGQFVADRGPLDNVAGMVVAIDGPALGNLQSRGYKYMVLDEPWLWEPGRLDEAKARQKDFRKLSSNKLLCISQGGEQKCEDWKLQYKTGIIHEWHVQCQGCGKYLVPLWSGFRPDGSRWGMLWDDKHDDRGFWDVAKAVPTARFECFYCGFAHVDTPRLKSNWNLTGKYIAEETDKNDSKASFHWSGVATYSFHDLVELFLNAANQLKTGSPTAAVKFFQKQIAEFANEQTVFQSAKNSARAVYEIDGTWELEDERALTVDCQLEGVYYWQARAWSRRAMGQTRRLGFGKVFGESDIVKLAEKFKVQSNHVLIDSGDKPKGPGRVYSMCCRNGWVPLKGVGTVRGNAAVEGFYHSIPRLDGRVERVMRSYSEPFQADPETGSGERCDGIRFSSDIIADRLDGLISSGTWIEPEQEDESEPEYRKQMSAEFKKLKRDKFSGRDRMIRVCPSRDNHQYDCAKMQVLFAILTDCIPDPLDNRTETDKAEAKAAA